MFSLSKPEPYDFNYLYNFVESARLQFSPARLAITSSLELVNNPLNPIKHSYLENFLKASLEIAERVTRKYKKPEFGIDSVNVQGKVVKIEQKIIKTKAFCNLLHFSKKDQLKQPKLLIVAPLAGHHATLLRGTVQDTLPFFDVYITDWIDASQVPISQGNFDMDNYIEYVIEFLEDLGPDIHILAVCQPTVPVLAAVAIMSAEKNKYIPKSMILMGGPIDARKSPTSVNIFATDRNIEWFEKHLITRVPLNYPGRMRPVYPGFLQRAGFISMNFQKHLESHIQLYKNLIIEEDEKALTQIKFYDEYLSVMDLPAEFYLQTIKEVFLDFSLATGKLVFRKRKVDLSAITKPALLGIEGERDDIAGVGQTKAALKLCSKLPENKKHYYLQKDVGHYGVFSGSKFRQFIVPVIKDFIYKYSK